MPVETKSDWLLLGKVSELKADLQKSGFLKELIINERSYVLTWHAEAFGLLVNKCNHMGAPLSKGVIKNGCVECPWHYWQFNHKTGQAISPSFAPLAADGGHVSSIPVKIENEELYAQISQATERQAPNYNTGSDEGPSLGREPVRQPGKIRVLGISTTAMDKAHPRFSTSEHLLENSLKTIKEKLDVETKVLKLWDLNFRHCEGFYSKSEKACTWPCSITKMDPTDEMKVVYENLIHWADVIVVGTPIRWGAASSLYYKMAERLNAVQNQITLKDRVLIKNKVVSLIITGGQDNIQAVAGQMLTFFTELGFTAPPFPFVGHSLGWTSENMQANMDFVQKDEHLLKHTEELVERSVDLAQRLIGSPTA